MKCMYISLTSGTNRYQVEHQARDRRARFYLYKVARRKEHRMSAIGDMLMAFSFVAMAVIMVVEAVMVWTSL